MTSASLSATFPPAPPAPPPAAACPPPPHPPRDPTGHLPPRPASPAPRVALVKHRRQPGADPVDEDRPARGPEHPGQVGCLRRPPPPGPPRPVRRHPRRPVRVARRLGP